jgi:hypothetical protein
MIGWSHFFERVVSQHLLAGAHGRVKWLALWLGYKMTKEGATVPQSSWACSQLPKDFPLGSTS